MAWPKGRPNPNSAAACEKMHAITRGKPLSPEHRAKLSALRRGRKLTPEHVEKIAAHNRGRVHTEQARAHMSASAKRKKWTAEHMSKALASLVAGRGKPLSELTKARLRAKAIGRPVSDASRAKISAANMGRSQRHAHRTHYNGQWFRSTWEARTARALDALGVPWSYEPKSFFLASGSRYTPDFYLPEDSAYWEVKGWMSPPASAKIRSFRSQFPDIPLVVIGEQALLALESASK